MSAAGPLNDCPSDRSLQFVENLAGVTGVVQNTDNFKGLLGRAVKDRDREVSKNQSADASEHGRSGRWPSWTKVGELEEAINGGVEGVEKAARGLWTLTSDLAGNVVYIVSRFRPDVGDQGPTFHERADLRARKCLASAVRRALRHAAVMGSGVPEARPSIKSWSTASMASRCTSLRMRSRTYSAAEL